MTHSARQHATLALTFFCSLPIVWLLVATDISRAESPSGSGEQREPAADPGSNLPSIPVLLSELDDVSYAQRQLAASHLANLGERALKPMALHGIESSPESSWRIRQIIEDIGTTGDEDTFYKSTGVLKLLYPVDDENTKQRIEELRKQWQQARKKKAIDQLRQLGATVEDPLGDVTKTDNAQMRWLIANQGVFVNGGGLIVAQSSTKADADSKKNRSDRETAQRTKPPLTRAELIAQVDEIIKSDTETNRERILGNADMQTAARADAINSSLRMGRHGVAVVNQSRFGVTVQFDNNFKGSAKEMESLKQIPHVTAVSFTNRKIDPAEMRILSDLPTINSVSFAACQFPNDVLAAATWPRLATRAAFTDQKVTAKILGGFRDSTLSSLTFTRCELTEGAHAELVKLKSLNEFIVRETHVSELFFETFRSIKTLTRVDLSLCKFDTRDYRKLARSRRNLRIDFTPQAFLGIRSSTLPRVMLPEFNEQAEVDNLKLRLNKGLKQRESQSNIGCEVGEVIAGSGAEQSGLKPGDWIETINEQPIEQFEDLRLHVAQHKVGETLRVQIRRNGQREDIEITLGPFPANAVR